MDYLKAKAGSGNNNKLIGSIYEHKFVVDAMLRGLYPHSPPSDMPCHDFIVLNPRGESLITQVRSTANMQKRGGKKDNYISKRFTVSTTCHAKQTTLNNSIVDILSVYVAPLDTWYHIPANKISSTLIHLYPHIIGSKGTWERYKDAWRLFEKMF